jgi:hypothetical protein
MRVEAAGGSVSHGWSIATSASTNSQFAGMLAGFVFTGIVILFAMRGSRYTQILSLLCPTFVVLGFDSYMFSHVTGSDDSLCTRVWTDGMFASGMLAIGAGGVVASVCWLLATHAEDAGDGNKPEAPAGSQPDAAASDEPGIDLGRVAIGMVYGVTIGIALLLAMTADRYLRIVSGDKARGVWLGLVWAVPVVVFVTVLAVAVARGRTRVPMSEKARWPPRPAANDPAGSRRSPDEIPAPPTAPDRPPPPPALLDLEQWALRGPSGHDPHPSGSPPTTPGRESSSPTTSGSTVCTGCPCHPARTARP